jgi:hydrogenase nickel incorporation protein HypB
MCVTCGCQIPQFPAQGAGHARPPSHDDDHGHGHGHDHDHGDGDDAASGAGAPPRGMGVFRPTATGTVSVSVEQDLLAKNDRFAALNRQRFAADGVLALNLVSSPGSGKTTLLVYTLEALRGRRPVAVVEGDQQTRLDADRIAATGAPVVQLNTGKGCHLDAHQVGHALAQLPAPAGGVLFIENVGNLVCPAAFDLGEAHKVVVLSVTEGEDKPLKYPDMFRAADLCLITKIDLLPYVPFDVDRALRYAHEVNPALQCLALSVVSGAGCAAWLAWLEQELGRRTSRARPAEQAQGATA